MIDMHCHILPGVDDGSPHIEESLAMLTALKKAGFTRVVATPHFYPGLIETPDEEIVRAFERLTEGAGRRNDGVRLDLTREYYLDVYIEDSISGERFIAAGERKVILWEFPIMMSPGAAAGVSFKARAKGYRIVLAHIERYADVIHRVETAEELRRMGFAIQVNWGSFLGWYGPGIKSVAEKLIKKGLVDVLGTDAHDLDSIEALFPAAEKRLKRLAGREYFRRLTEDNPLALLDGEGLD